MENKAQLTEMVRELDKRDARSSFLNFIQYVMPNYEVNWHHRHICETLDQFIFGDLNRLMIFAPPRSGKSQIVSRMLPAFILGNYPDYSIIAASYSASLASKMNRDVQRIMGQEQYVELFPHTRLASTIEKSSGFIQTSDYFEIVNKRGFYRSAGVNMGITGLGMNFGIIDDPTKDQLEASSPTYQDRLYDWFTSTFMTRLEKGGKVLITLTRWSLQDLSQKIQDLMKADIESDQYKIICFPAIKDTLDDLSDPRELGEPLWPGKYDLKRMKQIKASVGSRVWESLYQQRPSPESGNIVHRHWWKFYTHKPEVFDQIAQSWDLTFKEGENNDYVVGQVWGRIGSQRYLLDQIRGRISFTASVESMINLTKQWPTSNAIYVEEAANGAALIDTLKHKLSAIIPVRPRGTKVARANAITPQIEAGNVFLPDPMIAPWINDYIEEWANFPFGKHDDQIDATTQLLSKMQDNAVFDWAPVSMTKESIWL